MLSFLFKTIYSLFLILDYYIKKKASKDVYILNVGRGGGNVDQKWSEGGISIDVHIKQNKTKNFLNVIFVVVKILTIPRAFIYKR